MGKGPDQGDFETPTADTSSPDGPWPTEPDTATGADETVPPASPVDTHSTAPGDTIASTGASAGPADVEQLPTTSGTEVAVGIAGAAIAVGLIAVGVAMSLRNRYNTKW